MNRAERRKRGIKQPPPKMKHMTEEQFRQALNEAYREGVNDGFDRSSGLAMGYMLAAPCLVIHDRFNEIRLREFKGKQRVEHFFELCADVFHEYYKKEGTQSLLRLMEDVKEKTGFDLAERVEGIML